MAALLTAGAGAYANVTLFSDSFDAYPDQAAFEAVWKDTGASIYTLDSTHDAYGETGKSVRLASQTANYLGRFIHLAGEFNGTDASPLIFSYDMYLPTTSWQGARQWVELRGYAGDGPQYPTVAGFNEGLEEIVAIGVYNAIEVSGQGEVVDTGRFQGRAYPSGASSGTWYTLNQFVAPGRSTGWHNLKFEVRSSQISFYVDNTLAETVSRASPTGFDTIVLGSDLTSAGYDVWIDNIMLQQQVAIVPVPAPGAAVLALIGLPVVGWVKRRFA